MFCENGFNENGFMICRGLGEEFRINNQNGQFLKASMGGYYNVDSNQTEDSSGTPNMVIGKCSVF